jgi:hypothetical protein
MRSQALLCTTFSFLILYNDMSNARYSEQGYGQKDTTQGPILERESPLSSHEHR